ncbi:hypothetical protein C9374_001319 [Naegleria lovaniensis]|uniref:SH3 domain-containing protein n=1 Tax=Naegleria lovaniensis TaxID=51637 RepID=A0AA88GRV0_NAELO|nr:uncharacterized protein C9374_001319 [Naegleria lovaniensis]KAG2387725.1 hypothetical protein C9374_001319 [Naegleria lovaniensis]
MTQLVDQQQQQQQLATATTINNNNGGIRMTTGDSSPRSLQQALVLYDYDATSSNEMTIREHQIITIIKYEDDWSLCKNPQTSQLGYVPTGYIQIIVKPQVKPPNSQRPPMLRKNIMQPSDQQNVVMNKTFHTNNEQQPVNGTSSNGPVDQQFQNRKTEPMVDSSMSIRKTKKNTQGSSSPRNSPNHSTVSSNIFTSTTTTSGNSSSSSGNHPQGKVPKLSGVNSGATTSTDSPPDSPEGDNNNKLGNFTSVKERIKLLQEQKLSLANASSTSGGVSGVPSSTTTLSQHTTPNTPTINVATTTTTNTNHHISTPPVISTEKKRVALPQTQLNYTSGTTPREKSATPSASSATTMNVASYQASTTTTTTITTPQNNTNVTIRPPKPKGYQNKHENVSTNSTTPASSSNTGISQTSLGSTLPMSTLGNPAMLSTSPTSTFLYGGVPILPMPIATKTQPSRQLDETYMASTLENPSDQDGKSPQDEKKKFTIKIGRGLSKALKFNKQPSTHSSPTPPTNEDATDEDVLPNIPVDSYTRSTKDSHHGDTPSPVLHSYTSSEVSPIVKSNSSLMAKDLENPEVVDKRKTLPVNMKSELFQKMHSQLKLQPGQPPATHLPNSSTSTNSM